MSTPLPRAASDPAAPSDPPSSPPPLASADELPAVRASGGLPRPEPIEQLPILILFPHSRCNCRCLMCDIWRDTRKQELGADEVGRWTAEWRRLGVRQVALSGGEALLHGDLWTLCEHLRRAGIAITLLSTGLLLRRDADQVARYCSEVIVSLDGPQPVHDEIRNLPRAFAKLADGVAAVRQAAPRLKIGGRCTVQRANFRHLRGTVAAARAIGLDWLSLLAADVSSDAFNRPEPWEAARAGQVALTEDELPQLAGELTALEREHRADFRSGFVVEPPAKLWARLYEYYAALCGRGGFAPLRCNAPWVSAVIEADATVRPCFFQPPLGNLRQAASLQAILNAPAALAWRRGLDVERNAICRKCVCSLAMDQLPPALAGEGATAPAGAAHPAPATSPPGEAP